MTFRSAFATERSVVLGPTNGVMPGASNPIRVVTNRVCSLGQVIAFGTVAGRIVPGSYSLRPSVLVLKYCAGVVSARTNSAY